MGLREQKKQQTRKHISDLATRLFIERGYQAVTTAEIAQLAGVSAPTLFNYFASKEALVFDEDAEREAQLLAAVLERPEGVGILEALRHYALNNPAFQPEHSQELAAFRQLVVNTPELAEYERRMSMRYASSLASVILQQSHTPTTAIQAEAIAHFVLDAFYRASNSEQPEHTLTSLFNLLTNQWRG